MRYKGGKCYNMLPKCGCTKACGELCELGAAELQNRLGNGQCCATQWLHGSSKTFEVLF